ncbi:VOC family protein [Shouchella sp. 1P09AA]|uniref:VOC family protein n=1 Tax=unclassified Shouchella TaxID=2893065 RepID=UPI0039A3E5BD
MYERMILGEVELTVTNLDESLNFYRDIIGIKEVKVEGQRAELFVNEGSSLLILNENRDAKKNPGQLYVGLYHFALLYPDRASLGTQLLHLQKKQIDIGGADHLVSEAIYLDDPDGNGIELYCDRPRNSWTYSEDGSIRMDTIPLNVQSLLDLAGEWNGIPNGLTMGHVHMHVKDLTETEQFYKDVLQFNTMTHFGQQALFMSGTGYHHHFGFNTWVRNKITAPEPFVGMSRYTVRMLDSKEFHALRSAPTVRAVLVKEDETSFTIQDPSEMFIKFTHE